MSEPLEDCRGFAFGLPGAWEDHPWEDDSVAKVGKKIFVFFGSPERPGLSVKLPESAAHALSLSCTTPTGYGLGRHGWVRIDLAPAGEIPDVDLLLDWIEESYRSVALKRLIAELDAR